MSRQSIRSRGFACYRPSWPEHRRPTYAYSADGDVRLPAELVRHTECGEIIVKTNWILTALAGLIGLAVAINGKVMSVDVYAAEALFRKL